MSSQLKSETITRLKPVAGYTGVCVLLANGDDQICIVAENSAVLLAQVSELMPNAAVDTNTFIPVTIIQAQ
jgi:hypothetical protein